MFLTALPLSHVQRVFVEAAVQLPGPGTQCREHPFPSGQEAPGKTTAVAVDPGLPRFKFCSEPHLGPQSLRVRDKMATTSILFPPSPPQPDPLEFSFRWSAPVPQAHQPKAWRPSMSPPPPHLSPQPNPHSVFISPPDSPVHSSSVPVPPGSSSMLKEHSRFLCRLPLPLSLLFSPCGAVHGPCKSGH